jgi:uncharacterized protein YbjT (DUF2867 family)
MMRTILVTGATGAQGGSVARHLLADGGWRIRGLTRSPESEPARALAAAGVEIIQGDLDDRGSIVRALEGCEGLYAVTNFWEHFDREADHGRNIVDAAAEAGTPDIVFSSLPDVSGITEGELSVPHFDLKAQVERYSRAKLPQAAYLHIAFYYDNFATFFPPRRQEDGTYVVGFPQGDTSLAGVGAEDVGGVVLGMLQDLDRFRGDVAWAVGDDIPAARYAEIMSSVLDLPIVYRHVPRETFAALGFPGADDLAQMFDFYRRYVPSRKAEVEQSRELYPAIQDFETWALRHRQMLRSGLQ